MSHDVFNRHRNLGDEKELQNQIDLTQKYARVFSGPDGEAVLTDILTDARFLQGSFDPERPYVTAYNEGVRSVSLRILRVLNLDIKKVQERLEKNVKKS